MSPTRVLSLSVLLAVSSMRADAGSPTPREILDRIDETYAALPSYGDSGVVRLVRVIGSDRTESEAAFTTAFMRPGRFRFEYGRASDADHFVVQRSGAEVETTWGGRATARRDRTFEQAVAGAAGVSGGSGHYVPRLLMPDEVGGRRLTVLRDPERLADDFAGGVPCVVVSGYVGWSRVTIWAGEFDDLIRKVVVVFDAREMRVEKTIEYAVAGQGQSTSR